MVKASVGAVVLPCVLFYLLPLKFSRSAHRLATGRKVSGHPCRSRPRECVISDRGCVSKTRTLCRTTRSPHGFHGSFVNHLEGPMFSCVFHRWWGGIGSRRL